MKQGRASGWDEIRDELVNVAGEIGFRWKKRLLNTCMKQCKVPEDWRTGLVVLVWKNEMRCTRPRVVGPTKEYISLLSAEAYHSEITREDSRQEAA